MDFPMIFYACKEIMLFEFTYMGYTFNLWNVMVFSVVGFIILYFLFSFFKNG